MLDDKLQAAGFIAAAFLTACAHPSPYWAEEDAKRHLEQEVAEKSKLDAVFQPYVGKSAWLDRKYGVLVCPQKQPYGCIPEAGHLTVDGYERADDVFVWVHVTVDGAPPGWIRLTPELMHAAFKTVPPPPEVTIYPSFLDHLPRKVADERRKLPGVAIGMREDEVLAGAWGEPLSRKVVRSRRGLREEWHYPHGNALIFEDGVLEGFEK